MSEYCAICGQSAVAEVWYGDEIQTPMCRTCLNRLDPIAAATLNTKEAGDA